VSRVALRRKLLVVTNDFPPRQGGIQSFVYEIVRRLPPDQVAVYASNYHGAIDFDTDQEFPVHRHRTGLLIPTPSAAHRIRSVLEQYAATSVWFGAAAPLALLTPALRRAGATRVVATTHGHEVGWATLPGARQALRRIGDTADVVTYLGEYTRRRLANALGPRAHLARLTPGVDASVFGCADGSAIRHRYGLGDRPVIVCVSRLVPRKGQDTLIRALPAVRQTLPDACLLLVGRGPYEKRLRALAREVGIEGEVIFAGGVLSSELPSHFAAGDVFAMPCRTRRFGMDVEGLGIVYLEASAAGLPVVVGDSGGAPDAVIPGQTGIVVDGSDVGAVSRQVVRILDDRVLASRLGAAGRQWVEGSWQWDGVAGRLAELVGLQ
jgi:phosphatidyl-myo-inositol dimannoside synthase